MHSDAASPVFEPTQSRTVSVEPVAPSERAASVLNAQVAADDLRRGLAAIKTLPPEDRRDIRKSVRCLIALFGRDPPQRRASTIAAIHWRLYALCEIAKRREFRAWMHAIDPDAGIDLKVFAVAADEPLVAHDGQVGFDPDNVFRRLLGLTAVHGRA
jgi:hypothetical protein